jgi:hypothetical protein
LQIRLLGVLHCFMRPRRSLSDKGIVSEFLSSVEMMSFAAKIPGWVSAVLVLPINN